jgi:hypothetical protein
MEPRIVQPVVWSLYWLPLCLMSIQKTPVCYALSNRIFRLTTFSVGLSLILEAADSIRTCWLLRHFTEEFSQFFETTASERQLFGIVK